MIPLKTTNGVTFYISDQDLTAVSKYKWWADDLGYVRSTTGNVRLYRFLLAAKPGDLVDHVDRNPLNNTRENIRLTSPSNNRANSKKMLRKGKALSPYKGVSKKSGRKTNPWQVYICKNGRSRFVGVFASAVDAARAYDDAAIQLFGSFACTNESLYGCYWQTGMGQRAA